MARIVGVDLPKNKRGEVGLTYIYGIGRSTARHILDVAGISAVRSFSSTPSAWWISVAIAASVTVWVFPFAVSRPRTTLVRVRVRRRL